MISRALTTFIKSFSLSTELPRRRWIAIICSPIYDHMLICLETTICKQAPISKFAYQHINPSMTDFRPIRCCLVVRNLSCQRVRTLSPVRSRLTSSSESHLHAKEHNLFREKLTVTTQNW